MPQVSVVHVVAVDTNPLADDLDTQAGLHTDYDDLPAQFRESLQALDESSDSASCWSPGCNTPVGWVLQEDDEQPWRGGLVWRPVWLARDISGDGPVAWLCEDCAPGVPGQPS